MKLQAAAGHALAALGWLGLLDQEKKLSLTQLAVWITLIKLALAPSTSLVDLGALLVTVANYAHKRAVNSESQ